VRSDLIECSGIKELNIRKYALCAKYLSSKQNYDNQYFSKSIGGTEKERERESERLGGGREGDLVRKCGCHRKTQSLPQNISGCARQKKFQTKGQYCVDIHIPNELHSSNLFSEP
jgi:hypothetical protein